MSASDNAVAGAHPGGRDQRLVLDTPFWPRPVRARPGPAFGASTFEIVGVVAAPFTGTEPGVIVDVMLPAVMHPSAGELGSTWMRLLAIVNPGASLGAVRDQLQAQLTAYQLYRSPTFTGIPESLRQRSH